MRRLAVDLTLIFAPLCLLSAAFFLGDQPRYGIAFAVIAVLALLYVRPRAEEPAAQEDRSDLHGPSGSAGVGNVGGPTRAG